MRQNSWIALAIVFLVVFFAANNTAQSGVKPDWWVNSVFIAQRSGGNFIAGGGTTIVGVDDIGNDRVNITITATGAGVSNAFATIDTPSGTDPVADSATDTLQLLVTGADFSVTGSAAADSVTFDILANAGTDITADLEEEGQINATAVTGNAADDQIILGSGANTATWASVPNCTDTGGQHLNYTTATNTVNCGTSGGGAFSGEVDDTTNDALTFTTDDASPPADTTRAIFAKTTNDLEYSVPYPGGQHQFTVGGTGAATITEDRFIYPSSAGTPSSLANNDTWIDTQLDHFFARLNGISQAFLSFRSHWTIIMADGSGAPTAVVGDTLGTNGTVSNPTPDQGPATTFTSGAAAGNIAGMSGSALQRADLSPFQFYVFKLDQNANERAFIGLTTGGCATMTASDDPAFTYEGIHYSTVRGDTNWQYATDNGVTQTLTDLGSAVNTSVHFFVAYHDNANSRVIVQLDDGAQFIITSTIPGSSTNMLFVACVQTTEAVAKAIQVGNIVIEKKVGP